MNIARSSQRKRVLLIDDDPDFCSLLKTLAKDLHIQLDTFQSLEGLGSLERIHDYSLAIFDYDLGVSNGVELAEYVDHFCDEVPVIIVSGQSRLKKQADTWPKSIQTFVSKKDGVYPILDSIMSHVHAKHFYAC